MVKARLLPLMLLALPLTAGVAAAKAPATTPYNKYTLLGSTKLGAQQVDYRAYLILPRNLRDRTANGGPILRFGPIGSCRFNLSISARVVARTTSQTAADRAAEQQPASGPYVYSSGARVAAAWRVVRPRGSANVRAIHVMPVSLLTTRSFDGPTVPAWLEVRATANEHSKFACHSGGPRSVGAFLGEAFGALSDTAFSTNLPRLTGPPPAA